MTKIVERIRDKITAKYQQYEKEITQLYDKKLKVKEKVKTEININANPVKRKVRYYKAGKVTKTGKVTNNLTSNEYQLQ